MLCALFLLQLPEQGFANRKMVHLDAIQRCGNRNSCRRARALPAPRAVSDGIMSGHAHMALNGCGMHICTNYHHIHHFQHEGTSGAQWPKFGASPSLSTGR